MIDFPVGDTAATDDKLRSAKSMVRSMLTSKLSAQVAQSSTVDAFFDSLAGLTTIDRELGEALGLGFAHICYFDAFQIEGDQNWVRANEIKKRLKHSIEALVAIIPHALGTVTGSANLNRSVSVNSESRWWPQRQDD